MFLLIFCGSGTQISELSPNTELIEDLSNRFAGPTSVGSYRNTNEIVSTYIVLKEDKLVDNYMQGNASISLKLLAALILP